jgi:hypothetical protein
LQQTSRGDPYAEASPEVSPDRFIASIGGWTGFVPSQSSARWSRSTRLSRIGRRRHDASDATPEIAGLQEKYNIDPVDWLDIDASGTSEQMLKQCQTHFLHREAAQAG